jgi:hypothetical protein
VPPHEFEYQCQVAPAERVPVRLRVVESPEQIVDLLAEAVVGAEGVVQMYLAQMRKSVPY